MAYTAPHQGSSWPGAVLRVTVSDAVRSTVAVMPSRAQVPPALVFGPDTPSTSMTSLNAIEDTSAPTALDPAVQPGFVPAAERQSQRVQIENERRIILERIRERTSSRTGLIPDPPATSKSFAQMVIGASAEMFSALSDADNNSEHIAGALEAL